MDQRLLDVQTAALALGRARETTTLARLAFHAAERAYHDASENALRATRALDQAVEALAKSEAAADNLASQAGKAHRDGDADMAPARRS